MFRILVAIVASLFGAAVTTAAPPNVVMILGDDQGWTDYGFMGSEVVKTPHLDKLAAGSLAFKRGYVPSSLCRPSLATMITGLYPHQHKITCNDPPLAKDGLGNKSPVFQKQRQEMVAYIEKVPTLPRLLEKRGYVSYQAGKWWEGSACRCGGFTEGMTHGNPDKNGRHGDEGLTIGRQGLKPVFDFLDQAKAGGKPFYLWYAPMMPHSPHNPPERLLNKYLDKTKSIHVARYWAMCEWFDETVGDLLAKLEANGQAANTIVIYLHDNGWIQNPNSPNYAPKSKLSPYDGGTRTPILIRWPGQVKPRICDDLASSTDLVPTVLAAIDEKPTPAMSGLNLMSAEATRNRKAIFGEIFEHNAVDIHDPAANLQFRWVIAGEWKLIVPHEPNIKGGSAELYNLKADPFERDNLAMKDAARVMALTATLDAWWNPK